VATPLSWEELDDTAPDAFTIADAPRLLERPDPLHALATSAPDARSFVDSVEAEFARSGIVLETFDRFRS
jgi:DNA primase